MSEKQVAVVDGRGLYLGMFAESHPIADGHRRLPTITKCDLPVGEYFWKDDEGNPFGGAFWPIPRKPKIKGR